MLATIIKKVGEPPAADDAWRMLEEQVLHLQSRQQQWAARYEALAALDQLFIAV